MWHLRSEGLETPDIGFTFFEEFEEGKGYTFETSSELKIGKNKFGLKNLAELP